MVFSKFRMLSIRVCEHCEKLCLLNFMQCSGYILDPYSIGSLDPDFQAKKDLLKRKKIIKADKNNLHIKKNLSRLRQAKMTHKRIKNEEIPCFEVLGHPGVLFGGLEVSFVLGRPPWRPKNKFIAILDQQNMIFFSVEILLQFFGHQKPGSGFGIRIRIHLNDWVLIQWIWIRNTDFMNMVCCEGR